MSDSHSGRVPKWVGRVTHIVWILLVARLIMGVNMPGGPFVLRDWLTPSTWFVPLLYTVLWYTSYWRWNAKHPD